MEKMIPSSDGKDDGHHPAAATAAAAVLIKHEHPGEEKEESHGGRQQTDHSASMSLKVAVLVTKKTVLVCVSNPTRRAPMAANTSDKILSTLSALNTLLPILFFFSLPSSSSSSLLSCHGTEKDDSRGRRPVGVRWLPFASPNALWERTTLAEVPRIETRLQQ
ncbi:hypothetical protein GW17_00004528 [Ensete ventricosum]|nr:hypothetical protein GW17_00004528 [Ensete ventricosum]